MSRTSLKVAVCVLGLSWTGCAPAQPDDAEPTIEVGEVRVALTTCQSHAIIQFVNDANLSWAMQSCLWNPTSAAGRKEGLCTGYNGTKYDWQFEPSTGATYGGFVYGHRQLAGRTDWLLVPGSFDNGLVGACQCGKPCLYYTNLLVAQ